LVIFKIIIYIHFVDNLYLSKVNSTNGTYSKSKLLEFGKAHFDYDTAQL
jgi:hypothetical protein